MALIIALLSGCVFINSDDDCLRSVALGLDECDIAGEGWTPPGYETTSTTEFQSWIGLEWSWSGQDEDTCRRYWHTAGVPITPSNCVECTFMFEVTGTLDDDHDAAVGDCDAANFTHRYGYSDDLYGEGPAWVYGYYDQYVWWGPGAFNEELRRFGYSWSNDADFYQYGYAYLHYETLFEPEWLCVGFEISVVDDEVVQTDRDNYFHVILAPAGWTINLADTASTCQLFFSLDGLERAEELETPYSYRRMWRLSPDATYDTLGQCHRLPAPPTEITHWPWTFGIANPDELVEDAGLDNGWEENLALFGGAAGQPSLGNPRILAGGVARMLDGETVTDTPANLPASGIPDAHFSATPLTCVTLR